MNFWRPKKEGKNVHDRSYHVRSYWDVGEGWVKWLTRKPSQTPEFPTSNRESWPKRKVSHLTPPLNEQRGPRRYLTFSCQGDSALLLLRTSDLGQSPIGSSEWLFCCNPDTEFFVSKSVSKRRSAESSTQRDSN